jgi:2-octaprenyl-6-methoxyphenol hydroxylase
MNEAVHDIAIVGGGLVGASLACALAPLGYRIAMLEAVPLRAAEQPSYDDRTLVLSHCSCQILRGLEIWPGLEGRVTPVKKVVVTERGRPGRVELDPAESGVGVFGHVVEARLFGAAVLERLAQLDNVEVICPARVTRLEVGTQQVEAELSDGDQQRLLKARLVVAADGANSFVRQQMGISTRTHDYGQTAVICNITPQLAHNNTAFERFTGSGPFAVLPHVEDRCGLVWSTPTSQAESLMNLSKVDFLAAARQRFGADLGVFQRMGQRSSYPLRLVRALEDVRPRVVLMGNAAHAIHPVGAQGFNLGLRDVAVLADVLAESSDPDPGAMSGLARYSKWRRTDHDNTIAYSDGLARLFANPSPLVAAARTAGLLAHAMIPALRRGLASKAMGYRGRAPRLALGEQPVRP